MHVLTLFLCGFLCSFSAFSSLPLDEETSQVVQNRTSNFIDIKTLYENWDGSRDWMIGNQSDKFQESVRYISWDLEYTGFRLEDRLVQISGYELINGVAERSYHTYLNPGDKKSSTYAEAAHKLTPGFLKQQPKFKDIFDDLMRFIGSDICLFHNATSDVRMLGQEIERLPRIGEEYTIYYKCTYNMSRRDDLRSKNPEKVYNSPLKKKVIRCIPHDEIEKRNEKKRALNEQNKKKRADKKRKREDSQDTPLDKGIKKKKTLKKKSYKLQDLTKGISAEDVAAMHDIDLKNRYKGHDIPSARQNMDHDAFTDVTKTLYVIEQLKPDVSKKEKK